eukprot:s1397_g7.t1
MKFKLRSYLLLLMKTNSGPWWCTCPQRKCPTAEWDTRCGSVVIIISFHLSKGKLASWHHRWLGYGVGGFGLEPQSARRECGRNRDARRVGAAHHMAPPAKAKPPPTEQAPFSVEEYVLPRFEVSLTLDQSHLMVGSSTPATQRVTGKVFANFTFGEPLRGAKCSVVLWSPLMPWEATTSREAPSGGGTEHKALTSLTGLELDDTGTATFTADVSSDMMNAGGAIMVEATVVYGPTGERQSGTQQLPAARWDGIWEWDSCLTKKLKKLKQD